MNSDMSDIRDRILAWLVEDGYEVQKTQAPPTAPVEWNLLVKVKAPMLVNLNVQKLKGQDKIAVVMGVRMSPGHLNAFKSRPPAERVSIVASLISDVLKVCPTCIVLHQPPKPEEAEAFIVSREIPLWGLDRRILSDAVRVLANVYQLIVVRLTERLGPATKPSQDSMII